jgi:hypothetical protein
MGVVSLTASDITSGGLAPYLTMLEMLAQNRVAQYPMDRTRSRSHAPCLLGTGELWLGRWILERLGELRSSVCQGDKLVHVYTLDKRGVPLDAMQAIKHTRPVDRVYWRRPRDPRCVAHGAGQVDNIRPTYGNTPTVPTHSCTL